MFWYISNVSHELLLKTLSNLRQCVLTTLCQENCNFSICNYCEEEMEIHSNEHACGPWVHRRRRDSATKNVVWSSQLEYSLSAVDYYDVSDYESTESHRPIANSPLFLTIFSHDKMLHEIVSVENFTSGILGNWLRCERRIFSPIIALWAIFRLAMVALL